MNKGQDEDLIGMNEHKIEGCSEQQKSNMKVNVYFHTLWVPWHPKTHFNFQWHSYFLWFLRFCFEIPQNEKFLRKSDYLKCS